MKHLTLGFFSLKHPYWAPDPYKFKFAMIFEFCKMHAVSLTPHAKYDTACTIDEQFERPWQPLKGKSIKNINVPELAYPTPKKIY
jgi:hypothetical protein